MLTLELSDEDARNVLALLRPNAGPARTLAQRSEREQFPTRFQTLSKSYALTLSRLESEVLAYTQENPVED